MAIENTSQYRGLYHVLGGIISPMDGIGPSQLNIDSLADKAAQGKVREIIMALSTTMEGDTTIFYIYKKLKPYDIVVSTLARGVAIGNDVAAVVEVAGKRYRQVAPGEHFAVAAQTGRVDGGVQTGRFDGRAEGRDLRQERRSGGHSS